MDARHAFLLEHARLHSRSTTGVDDVSFEDGVWEGLGDDDLRARPNGLNSVVWIFWHISRFEDVIVNAVIRGEPEVFDREAWETRLNVGTRVVGTETSDAEAADLTQRLGPSTLRAYRAAVGRSTRSWAEVVDFASLDQVPDVVGRLSRSPDPVGERARWLGDFWQGRTAHSLLTLPVIAHGYVHIGEARVTRARLGAQVP